MTPNPWLQRLDAIDVMVGVAVGFVLGGGLTLLALFVASR